MTDKKISDLTAGAPAQASDAIPIARAGANFKLSLSDLSGVVGAGDTLNTVASSGASQTVNYTTADVWDITLTANCTFTLAGFVNGKPNYLTLVLRQDGTGSRTVTWPAITWIGSGIAPTLQTAASSADSVVLFSFDGGSTVFGIAQTSASGLRAGTSFPGSPSAGDLFYRTDRRILYEYDSGTTRWLSLDRKYVPMAGGDSLWGNGSLTTIGSTPIFEDVYIETWSTRTYVSSSGSGNNGSNFWTVTLNKNDSSFAATAVASVSTNLDSSLTVVAHDVSVGVVVSAASFKIFTADLTKTGTPGAHYFSTMLVLRSAG